MFMRSFGPGTLFAQMRLSPTARGRNPSSHDLTVDSVKWEDGLRVVLWWFSFPEGPKTQYLRSLVPNTIQGMAFGTRDLKYWVLEPSKFLSFVLRSEDGHIQKLPMTLCGCFYQSEVLF